MARQRSKRSSGNTATTEVSSTSTSTSTSTNTNTNTHTQGVIRMPLTQEQIAALLGSTRTKGVYIKYLNDFVSSGEGGVCVNDEWVDLKDKKATTLKQGFENAKSNKEAVEGAENVKVVANGDQVFLLNLGAAGIESPEA